jgi:hypothetical protein
MIECFVTGLLAWRDGQPGQVGNEAATAVFHQCRGSGSSPSFFLSFSAGIPQALVSRPLASLMQSGVWFRVRACNYPSGFSVSSLLHLRLFFSIGSLAVFNEASGARWYVVHSSLRAIVTDTISS